MPAAPEQRDMAIGVWLEHRASDEMRHRNKRVCVYVVSRDALEMRLSAPAALLLELAGKTMVVSCGFGVGICASLLLSVVATCLPLCLGAAWVRMDKMFPED